SAAAGPPAFWGSRNFQLTDVPKAGDRAAAGRGMAMTSAVLAGVIPDSRTRPAPPARAAHRPESGIQASASGPRAVFPASCAATAEGGWAVTAKRTQWPLTCGWVRLKTWPRWRTTGPISLAATTFTTSGWSVQSLRVMTARAPSASRRVTAMAAERPVSAAVRVRRCRAGGKRLRRRGPAFTASLSQKGRGSPARAADPRTREPPQARQRRPGRLRLLGLRGHDCSGPWRGMTPLVLFRWAGDGRLGGTGRQTRHPSRIWLPEPGQAGHDHDRDS